MAHSDPATSDRKDQAEETLQGTSSPENGRREYTGVDRRSPTDRRQVHNLGYFERDGVERRKGGERRRQVREPRRGWVRVSDWTSAIVGRPVPTADSPVVYRIDEGE